MNITKSQLKQLIKEELKASLREEESWGPTVEDPELVEVDKLVSNILNAVGSFQGQQAVQRSRGASHAANIISRMADLIGRVVRLAPEQQKALDAGLEDLMYDVQEFVKNIPVDPGGEEGEWTGPYDKPGGQPRAYSRTGTRTSVDTDIDSSPKMSDKYL